MPAEVSAKDGVAPTLEKINAYKTNDEHIGPSQFFPLS